MKKYIITSFVLLFAAFLLLPILSVNAISLTSAEKSYSSYSIEEIESLIAKLQKQLEEMKKGAQCFVSEKDLSIGDGEDEESKKDVVLLQEFLMEKGYLNIKKSTGYFGKITKSSLMKFQKDSGVDQTGELNSSTRNKVKGLYCKKNILNKKEEIKKESDKTINQETKSAVSKISLFGENNKISWETEGYSKSGFKIVWSKKTAPTYPTREGDKYIYLSDPSSSSTAIEAFNGEGVYYVRVCEYLGGSCGIYSNEINLIL